MNFNSAMPTFGMGLIRYECGPSPLAKGPQTFALAKVTVKKGARATFHFHVKALTKTTSVTLGIFKNGRPKKKLVLGSRTANATLTYRWVCRLPKGTFTWRVYAIDANHRAQTATGSNRLTVK